MKAKMPVSDWCPKRALNTEGPCGVQQREGRGWLCQVYSTNVLVRQTG